MTAPPGHAPTTEAAAPERHRAGENHLSRTLRDEVARRFMAEFPGMSGATAVRYAKAMLADPDAFLASATANRSTGMSRERLARLMAEMPLGLRNRSAARQGRDYRPRDDMGRLVTA